MITNWGYEISELDSILSQEEFNQATAGKYLGDDRVPQMIKASESAVRNYCGWHLFPASPCILKTRAHDIRLTTVGHDTVIQIPARYIEDVVSVKVGGEEKTDYSVDPNGMIRLYDCLICSRKTQIEIEYTAGLPDELADGLKEIVADLAVHSLAQSYGVQSEAAGGVSISYSATWMSGGRLSENHKEALSAYRLQGVM